MKIQALRRYLKNIAHASEKLSMFCLKITKYRGWVQNIGERPDPFVTWIRKWSDY